MKLTITELNVIWETLNSSTRIMDRGDVFMYGGEVRKKLATKIFEYLSSISVTVEAEE